MESNEPSVSKELNDYVTQLSFEKKLIGGLDEESGLSVIQKVTDICQAEVIRLKEENAAVRQQNDSYLMQLGSQKEVIASYAEKTAGLTQQLKNAELSKDEYGKKSAQTVDMLAELSEMKKNILAGAYKQSDQIIEDAKENARQLMEEGVRQLNADIAKKKSEMEELRQGFWEMRKSYKLSFDKTISHLRNIQSDLTDIIHNNVVDTEE